MRLYYFDTRDNDLFIEDDTGVMLPDLEAVKFEAGRALGELARDVLPGSVGRDLTIEVRDGRHPVLKALLHFEALVLA